MIIYNLLIPGGTREWEAEKGGRGTAAARRGSLAQGSVMDSFSNFLTIRYLILDVFSSADSVIQRDLFQLRSTRGLRLGR